MITLPVWVLLAMLLVLVLVALGVLSAVMMANRLNRLHIRTDAARLSLEGALSARAAVVVALQPDLASPTHRAGRLALRADDMGARSDAENQILVQLDSVVRNNASFIEAAARVDLAARFYNDAVSATLALRRRPFVRLFGLAGSATLPEYYEAMDVDHAC